MVKKCIVCGCAEKSAADLSFHRFPIHEQEKLKWMEACKITVSENVHSKFVCSKHFKTDDFDDTYWPKRKLLKGVVPTASNIYFKDKSVIDPMDLVETSYTANLPGSPQVSQSATSSSKLEPCELPEEFLPKNALVDARYIGDLQAAHFSTPRRAKRHIDFIRHKSNEDKKKIKVLRMEKARLLTRISTLSNLLDDLKENELISDNAYDCIQENTPESLKILIDRRLLAKNRKYDPQIRAFVIT